MNSPSQNTGDENMIVSIPTKTAASGIDGQKLLFREKKIIGEIGFDTRFECGAADSLTHLYIIMKRNHRRIEPQMEQCVIHVHEFVIKPALKQTVTTTYCNKSI